MATEKSIIRKQKNKSNPYVMIAKSVFEDERLSWKAKGLMGYLLSRPDDWQIIVSDLVKRAKDGRESVLNAMKELIKLGYLRREQNRAERGRFGVIIYEVFEEPTDVESEENNEEKLTILPTNLPQSENPITVNSPDSPQSGFPYTVKPETAKPYTENPQLLINDFTNKEIELINNNNNTETEDVVVVFEKMKQAGIKTSKRSVELLLSQANGNIEWVLRLVEYASDNELGFGWIKTSVANGDDVNSSSGDDFSTTQKNKYDVFYQYYKT